MIETVNLTESLWIIGDVHGEFDMLMEVIDQIPEHSTICFVGDLIDRGKDSQKVVAWVKENGHHCTVGNHEVMSVVREMHREWLKHGGVETLKSYDENSDIIDTLRSNKDFLNDLDWFRELPFIIKFLIPNEKPLYVSHTGIDLHEEDEEIIKHNRDIHELVFNRKIFKEVDFAVNIHGHSPLQKHMFRIGKSQIAIDTGAGKGGFLTAIEYPSLKRVFSSH